MSRLTDLFKVPTVVTADASHCPTPFKASCPKGDWESPRWVSTMRTAREQQARHWVREHYGFDGSPDGGWGSGWGNGLDY